MSEPSLDGAFDELYGGDPSEFVATRKRLAAELRGRGDKTGAKELQGAAASEYVGVGTEPARTTTRAARRHVPRTERRPRRRANPGPFGTTRRDARGDSCPPRRARRGDSSGARAARQPRQRRISRRDRVDLARRDTDDDLAKQLRRGPHGPRVARTRIPRTRRASPWCRHSPHRYPCPYPHPRRRPNEPRNAGAGARRARRRERALSAADAELQEVEARVAPGAELDEARRARREAQQLRRQASRRCGAAARRQYAVTADRLRRAR